MTAILSLFQPCSWILGYDTTYQFPHTIVGRDGAKLNDHFKPYPRTYLSLCTEGFPNFFMLVGPNGALGAGSLLAMMEKQVDYIVQVAQKMQFEEIKSVEPKKDAIDDFDEYLEVSIHTLLYHECILTLLRRTSRRCVIY